MTAIQIRPSVAILTLSLMALVGPHDGLALTAPTVFESVKSEDRLALEALALYPEDVRHAILEVAQHSQGLVGIDEIRSGSERDFQTLLEDSSREDQEMFWELVRHPGLVAEIVEGGRGGRGSRATLERIAARHPEEVRPLILEAGKRHYDLLVEIFQLDRETDRAFEALIEAYPPHLQAAFRRLLELPEVLTILNARLRLAVWLGAEYERDPRKTEARFADLNLEVARKQATEREEWERALEEDPSLREEFEESSASYAREHGYDADWRPTYSAFSLHIYPYPYWFGYPIWLAVGYSYPVWYSHYLWYPYPYWAHTGFYYSSHQQLAVFAAPSFFFLSWHAGHQHQQGHHRRVSDHFTDHFQHKRYPIQRDRPRYETHHALVSHPRRVAPSYARPRASMMARLRSHLAAARRPKVSPSAHRDSPPKATPGGGSHRAAQHGLEVKARRHAGEHRSASEQPRGRKKSLLTKVAWAAPRGEGRGLGRAATNRSFDRAAHGRGARRSMKSVRSHGKRGRRR